VAAEGSTAELQGWLRAEDGGTGRWSEARVASVSGGMVEEFSVQLAASGECDRAHTCSRGS